MQNERLSIKEMMTTKEAADYLGLSVGYLYKLTMQKKIPYYKPFGNRCYFKAEELQKFIENCRVYTADELQQRAIAHTLLK